MLVVTLAIADGDIGTGDEGWTVCLEGEWFLCVSLFIVLRILRLRDINF